MLHLLMFSLYANFKNHIHVECVGDQRRKQIDFYDTQKDVKGFCGDLESEILTCHHLNDFGRLFGNLVGHLGVDFCKILACRSRSSPRVAKRAPKGLQELPKSGPRVHKSCPRATQERPKSGQEQPKSGPAQPRWAQERPRAAQECPRGARSDPKMRKSEPRGFQKQQKGPQEADNRHQEARKWKRKKQDIFGFRTKSKQAPKRRD